MKKSIMLAFMASTMLLSNVAAIEFSDVDSPLDESMEINDIEIEVLSDEELAELDSQIEDEAYAAITDDQRQQMSALIESLTAEGLLTSYHTRAENISINDQQVILNGNDGVSTATQARMAILTQYINSGSRDPWTEAYQDACAFAVNLRNSYISECKSSLSAFKSRFNDSRGKQCMMDWWNNCYSRAYGQKLNYSSSQYFSAFTTSYNGGELVKDYYSTSKLTDARISALYRSNWWYH